MAIVLLAAAPSREEEVRPQTLVAEALRILNQIERPRDRARVLRRAALVQYKLGDRRAAMESIRLAIEATEQMEEAHRRVDDFVDLADSQAKIGDEAGARKTLERASAAAAESSDALSAVAKGWADLGDRAAAEKTFDRAVQAVDKVEPVKRLVSIAKARQVAKDERGAEATLKKAYALLTGEPNARVRIAGLREIGVARAARDLSGGMNLLQLALIDSDLIKDKEAQIGERIDLLLAMAEVKRKSDPDSAATMLRMALSESEGLPKGEVKNWKLSAIVIAHIGMGDLKSAFEIKKRIDDHWGRNDTLLPTVSAQLEAGDLPGALTSALSIDGKDFLRRDLALSRVAAKQAESGDFDGALKSFDQIQYEPAKSTALAATLAERAKRGEIQPAMETANARNPSVERAVGLIAIAGALVEKR